MDWQYNRYGGWKNSKKCGIANLPQVKEDGEDQRSLQRCYTKRDLHPVGVTVDNWDKET